MNIVKKSYLCLFIIASTCLNAKGQETDTAPEINISSAPPKTQNQSELSTGLVFISNTGHVQILTVYNQNEQKGFRFYKDHIWLNKDKTLFEANKLHLNLKFEREPNAIEIFQENPLYGMASTAMFVASLLNHQVKGVNKEMEERILKQVYTRKILPSSVKDPFVEQDYRLIRMNDK